MDDSRRTHLIRLRDINQTRLNELEVKKARLGINCPPEILTEIDEIKKVLQQLNQDINNESVVAGNAIEHPKIFLTNSAKDGDIAQTISHAISRITLGQIEVVSLKAGMDSDDITPLSVWFDKIQAQYRYIKTLIVILTPSSISENSIYFESGIVASKPDCRIIPVCIGVDGSHEISFPLSMYQRYQLSDYNSFDNFARYLLGLYNINFDQEMVEPILKRAIAKIVEISSSSRELLKRRTQTDIIELLENIKRHIDRRFLELFEIQSHLYNDTDLNKDEIEQITSYSVPIYLNIRNLKGQQFIDITINTLVQDVLNAIYYMISNEVEPYTYLYKWILHEKSTRMYLIIHEVSILVPARILFNSKYEWEVIELEKPYDPSDEEMIQRIWALDSSLPIKEC